MVESRIWRVGCGWVTKMVESRVWVGNKDGGEQKWWRA